MDSTDTTEDALLTIVEVADFLSVSPRTVQRYVADGRLTAITLPSGRGLRFRRTDLDSLRLCHG